MFHGERLKQLRTEHQLSINHVAQQTGISRSYITLIESGKRQPNPDFQERLATFFEVPLETFLKTASKEEAFPVDPEEEFIPISDFQLVENYQKEKVDSSSSNTFPDYLVFGMVHGVLQQIRHSLINEQLPLFDKEIAGRILITPFGVQELVADFRLKSNRGFVSLSIQNLTSPWTIVNLFYCAQPDVVLQMNDPAHLPESYAYELIWFTEYASLFDQITQSRKWKEESKIIAIHNPILSELLDLMKSP